MHNDNYNTERKSVSYTTTLTLQGSIVGTPIHMAPELFSGQYDNSVDVYAFGILFWYLCAGTVRLPHAFEQCQNKEHLWNNVRKGPLSLGLKLPVTKKLITICITGARPERLSYFDEECWRLMESCWAGDPSQRPLLGVVQPKLQAIQKRFQQLHYKYGPESKQPVSQDSNESSGTIIPYFPTLSMQ